jgi:outer membrane scaffolding protein for murein synthesis (MipA/OmpV family)
VLRGRLPWLSTIGVWLALAATAPAARAAAGEDEWQLSARLGLASVDVDGRSPLGELAGADLEYGITDAWALRLSVGTGFHPVDAVAETSLPKGTVRTNMALAGVTYTIDVLRLVPYIEVGVGVINFGGAVLTPGTTLDAELGLGADYLVTRHWALGGLLNYQFTPAQLFGSPMDFGGTSFYFAVSARVSWMF